MPKYTFGCSECDFIGTQNMTISEFVKKKKEKKECSQCENGVLFHKLGSISNKVDKDSSEIIDEIKEGVRKTVDKIKAGNQNTIDSIYGDTPNPYKYRR